MGNAIVIGASSGMGRSIAGILTEKGYRVGVTGRRADLLQSLHMQYPDKIYALQMDIQAIEGLETSLESMAAEMGGIDLVVIAAAIYIPNRDFDFSKELDIIRTNVEGFTCIADWAIRRFREQGHGHLVNISSIVCLRGTFLSPAYSASKAFQANYLEGLRLNVDKTGLPIFVTDIRPGFVNTDMTKGRQLFWMSAVEKAATQIVAAIQRKRRVAYITRRWTLVAWLMQWMPYPLLRKAF
jgi:short-subunit dehydrogenase